MDSCVGAGTTMNKINSFAISISYLLVTVGVSCVIEPSYVRI